MAYPNIPSPRRAKRPDDTSSHVLSTVQKLVCGWGYLRAADGASFCTLADGVVGQMIRCTNTGRFFETPHAPTHLPCQRLLTSCPSAGHSIKAFCHATFRPPVSHAMLSVSHPRPYLPETKWYAICLATCLTGVPYCAAARSREENAVSIGPLPL